MLKKSDFLCMTPLSCIKKAIFCACLLPFSLNVSALTFVSSSAPEASHVLKNAAGALKSISCYSSSASTQYMLIFNSATVPAEGTVPIVTPVVCPAGGNCNYDFTTIGGLNLSTGIVWTNSSTAATKTIGGATMMCTGAVQ